MTRRILAALVTAALAAALTVAAPPASAVSTTHTLAQTEAKLKGLSAGPNANTYWGQATVNGTWTSYLDCHNVKHYVAKLDVTDHNPTIVPPTARSVTPHRTCTPGINPTLLSGSWYNPASWNWSKIWGSIWDTISACFAGGTRTTVGTLTAQAAVAAVAEGATFEVTAVGVAVLMLGGCFAAIGW
ncbi:MAG TPA: hypothetical protein VGN35_00385 [Jatrophihabitantaceae bacterium]|jgi:hypothetical protein|nr:hypothetical protein [Jatrophihabitantaceae bacterium]